MSTDNAARERCGIMSEQQFHYRRKAGIQRLLNPSNQDYKTLIFEAVRDENAFLRMTLSKRLRDDGTNWVKIVVRPVTVKGKRKVQFSYFDPRKDITKNYPIDQIEDRLGDALAIPFGQIHVQSTTGDLHIRLNRRGEAYVSKAKPTRPESEPELSHDREKAYLLPVGKPDRCLQELGIMNSYGGIKGDMQGKFRQINEFLRVLQPIAQGLGAKPLDVVDCGCGNAYLTFAAYHFLADTLGLSVKMTGVDVNEELVKRNRERAAALGWKGISFSASSIAEYQPSAAPDLVLSLHACDTATDEAIARGILWGAKTILAAPCCQHELNAQLASSLFQPVLRHGILKERLGDILTDAFRALVLRIMGYRTDVMQFVDPEHTAKNLLIRAELALKPGDKPSVREYRDLKEFWSVTPAIEAMLGEKLTELL